MDHQRYSHQQVPVSQSSVDLLRRIHHQQIPVSHLAGPPALHQVTDKHLRIINTIVNIVQVTFKKLSAPVTSYLAKGNLL